VSSDSVQPSPNSQHRLIVLVMSVVAVVVAGMQPAVFAMLSKEAQPWNLSIIGAIGLFAAARLGFWPAVGFTGLAIGFKDLSIYMNFGWKPSPMSWLYFIAYALIGWALLRRTRSPLRIGAGALTGSLLFFLVSNFESWVRQSQPYGYTLAGLAECYVAGVPFFRGTILGDLAFTAVLFGVEAAFCHAFLPAKQTVTVESEDQR
jgi:hypothetical protein